MSQTNQTNNIAYLYNPANYSEEELIENFIVRLNEFNSIFQVIKNDDMKHPPQHFLIQGLRGNGKTTLLRRLFYEVKNDPQLSKNLIPVIFDEEEYGVRTLYKLWERIAENIEDNYSEFTGIYDEMMKHVENDDYEETAYKILKNKLNDKGMKLVLFFDNFGEVLEKFNEKEARRLREILMGENFLRIVGASSIMLESFYDYFKPFYEFFKIIQLNGLTKTEALEFLKKIAENHDKPEVVKIIENHPERVETLRVLTEGVPRTMLLLFEIFADNDNGNSFEDLEFVLDRVTPLYKHRMDDMSGIQQEIVDIIARNWDGIEVSTIAEKSKMDSKSISSQLNVLSKNDIISKIPTNTKNNLYILKERFFNIWYLMRYGRKNDKNRVLWLTRFLEAWLSNKKIDTDMIFENNLGYGAVSKIINDLRSDKIEEGVLAAREFLSNEEVYEKYNEDITLLLIFMMAKNQYNSVLKIFNENNFEIKDRFKPVYYALMHFMKDKFPNEYLKMGSELKETVEEIIKEVEKYRNW